MGKSTEMELFWSISRSEYLTIPRSIIQEMPKVWQDKLAVLLDELDSTVDWRPKDNLSYWVQLGTYDEESEKVISQHDLLKEYRHGNDYAKELFKVKRDQENWEN